MKRLGLMLLGTMLVVIVIGCGGGGGGGESGISTTAGSLRQMRIGDEWEYKVSTPTENGSEVSTRTYQVTAQTEIDYYGNTCRVIMRTNNAGDYVDTFEEFWSQDSNGTIYYHGWSGSDSKNFVKVPASGKYALIKSPIEVGDSYSATVTYTYNHTEIEQTSVLGRETVTVPAGTFQCFKVHYIETDYIGPVSWTSWYAPEVGWFVKNVFVSWNGDNTVSELVSYTSR